LPVEFHVEEREDLLGGDHGVAAGGVDMDQLLQAAGGPLQGLREEQSGGAGLIARREPGFEPGKDGDDLGMLIPHSEGRAGGGGVGQMPIARGVDPAHKLKGPLTRILAGGGRIDRLGVLVYQMALPHL